MDRMDHLSILLMRLELIESLKWYHLVSWIQLVLFLFRADYFKMFFLTAPKVKLFFSCTHQAPRARVCVISYCQSLKSIGHWSLLLIFGPIRLRYCRHARLMMCGLDFLCVPYRSIKLLVIFCTKLLLYVALEDPFVSNHLLFFTNVGNILDHPLEIVVESRHIFDLSPARKLFTCYLFLFKLSKGSISAIPGSFFCCIYTLSVGSLNTINRLCMPSASS